VHNHVNKPMQWINVHTSSNLIRSKVNYMHKIKHSQKLQELKPKFALELGSKKGK